MEVLYTESSSTNSDTAMCSDDEVETFLSNRSNLFSQPLPLAGMLPYYQVKHPLTETRKYQIKPGISKAVFQAIKEKMKYESRRNRLCTLLFTETPLEPHLDYLSQEDKIIGFEDDGWNETTTIANTVTVFMLRSVFGKWKQPIAFAFTDSSMRPETIVRYYKEIVKEATAVNLHIVASVCTDSDNNREAIDSLLEETRKNASSGDKIDGNTIVLYGHKIVSLFDTPRLLLSLRNHLLDNDLSFVQDGVVKIAKWRCIRETYERAKTYNYLLGVIGKISGEHIDPKVTNRRQKILMCIQTFSKTFGHFMCTFGSLISNESVDVTHTGELLTFMNRIFDSVNRDKVEGKSSHLRVWVEGKKKFSQMKFLGLETTVLSSWYRTLDSMISLRKNLFYMGYHCYPIKVFNLDALESYLDIIRCAQEIDVVPTCKLFIRFYYKTLFIKNLYRCYPSQISCEKDTLTVLVRMAHIRRFVELMPKNLNNDWVPPPVPENTIDYFERTAVICVSNYLHGTFSTDDITCSICWHNLFHFGDMDPYHYKLITVGPSFEELMRLVHIKVSVIKALIRIYFHVQVFLPEAMYYPRLSEMIISYLEILINLELVKCWHTKSLKTKLFDDFVKFLIRDYVATMQRSCLLGVETVVGSVPDLPI